MTVFMSPRTSYVLGRYRAHFALSVAPTVCFLLMFFQLIQVPVHPSSLTFFGVSGMALVSKRGRRVMGRSAQESFYGVLHGFTGVCSQNGNDEVGGGSGHVEGD